MPSMTTRRTRLADALFADPPDKKSNTPHVKEYTLTQIADDIRVHRASQRYSTVPRALNVFECIATVVDMNPVRLHVDEDTAAAIQAITDEYKSVWTVYRGGFVVDTENTPIRTELYLGDTVAPRATLRSYKKDGELKWTMDVINIRLISTGLHFSIPEFGHGCESNAPEGTHS